MKNVPQWLETIVIAAFVGALLLAASAYAVNFPPPDAPNAGVTAARRDALMATLATEVQRKLRAGTLTKLEGTLAALLLNDYRATFDDVGTPPIAALPVLNPGNTGTDLAVTVGAPTSAVVAQTWTLSQTPKGGWTVTGSVAGLKKRRAVLGEPFLVDRSGLMFTITCTDCAAGDRATVAVTAGTGKRLRAARLRQLGSELGDRAATLP